MSITAILTGYNRGQYLEEQLESIKAQTISPDEIMLWYNKGSQPQYYLKEVGKAAYCTYNFSFFSRFAFAFLAKSEYIAIFDDDTIPGTKWFENCLKTMETHPGIMGTAGIVLQGNYYHPHHKIGWASPKQIITEVDLVGHAWFFKKEWLQYIWKEEPYSYDNGEDIHFSYMAQKYGGIKTYVPIHYYEDHETWGSLKAIAYGSDEFSSWKISNHGALRNEIVYNAVDNGWKPLYLQGE